MKRVLLFTVILLMTVAVFGQQKYALVIGNSNYTGISRLNNPVNDANDMEAALKGLGFTVVKVLNGNLEQMENAVLNLRRSLGGTRNTYGFFFYAGHGVQANGENYLIPINADNIRSESQLRDRAVSLQFILDSLSEAGNELNMIVLDACRDNPFSWARSGSRGLSVVSHAPSGSIVMYATGANSTASDGTGRNGLFTGHLLNNLKQPGLSVFDVFDKTMGDVIELTNGTQHPELSLRYAGATRAFLGTHPVAQQPTQPPAPAVQPTPTPTPTPVQPAAMPQNPVPNNMVRINGGTFTMGSPANEPKRDNNEVQHQVTVSSFYMGKYEVTQKEYQEIMGTNPSYYKGNNLPVENITWYDAIEYCNARSLKEGLTPAYTIDKSRSDPNNKYNNDKIKWVVTWNRNANGYRLPTEAEWEYACRAGTTTSFNTGNSITTRHARFDTKAGTYEKKVGSFKSNSWGLYDMHGNVGEWCWDWYGNYGSESQTDPQGASSGTSRVYRGGTYSSEEQWVRSSRRGNVFPSSYWPTIGFRLVRNG